MAMGSPAHRPCCGDSGGTAVVTAVARRARAHAPFCHQGHWSLAGAGAGTAFICHRHTSPERRAPQIPSLHCPAVPLCVLLLKLQVPTLSAATSPTGIMFALSESLRHSLQSPLAARQETAEQRTHSSQLLLFSSPEIRAAWR